MNADDISISSILDHDSLRAVLYSFKRKFKHLFEFDDPPIGRFRANRQILAEF